MDGFGADPRRVEMAGGKKYDDNQSGTIKARFEALNIDYSDGDGKKDDEEYEPTMDSEEEEKLIFFYHPDHLGSTSYVTDADGNIAQHVECDFVEFNSINKTVSLVNIRVAYKD